MCPDCIAIAKSTGKRCTHKAIKGGTVCHDHGAGAPQVKAKAKQRIAEEKARAVMAKRGLPEPVAITSTEAMIWSVSAKYAEVCWLRDMVSSIPEQDLVWGKTREKSGGEDYGTTHEAKANIWWVMLRGAEDQLVRYAKDARAANVDEAMLSMGKRQGAQWGAVVQVVLKAMFDVVVDTLRARGVSDAEIIDAVRQAWTDAMGVIVPREFRRLNGIEGEA